MDPGLEFTRQRRVDHAVAFEPALSPECVRYDIEAEVRLATRPMPGMPRMQMGFVFNVQALGRESHNELGVIMSCIPIVRPGAGNEIR